MKKRMIGHHEESEVVEKARTDDYYFEILYEHYFPVIYGFIFKRTGSREVTEDIVSDIFLKVFINLGKYTDNSFKAWIFKIATNKLIDHYRKNARHPECELDENLNIINEKDNPEKMLQIKDERVLIDKAIALLNPKYQQILLLKYFGEFTTKEISLMLGINENNTRVLASRALAKFKQIFDKNEYNR